MTNEIWRNDNKERNTIKIILNIELEPTQTPTPTATGTATINLRLRVNHQPAISLRRLLKTHIIGHEIMTNSTTQ